MELRPDSIVVARPIREVFEYVTDPRNDPAWHTTVVSVRQTSAGPLGAGTVFTGTYDSHRLLSLQAAAIEADVEERPQALDATG